MMKIFRLRYIFYCCLLMLVGWGIAVGSAYLWKKWQFKRDYPAEHGDLAAQNKVGHTYGDGMVVTQDDTRAVYWYRKRLNKDTLKLSQGIPEAYTLVGMALY